MTHLAGDFVQVLVDGYDLTGDGNKVGINDQRDTYDVSSFASDVHKFILGKRSTSVDFSGYFNAAAAKSHPALNGVDIGDIANSDGILSVLLGQNADPDEGDPVFSMPILQGNYALSPAAGSAIGFSSAFASQGELGRWGRAIAVPTEVTNSGNGSYVTSLTGSASSNGGVAYLHVLTAAVGYTYSIQLEDSDGGAPQVLASFTLDGTSVASEMINISGTIEKDVRWKVTRSGSSGTPNLKFAMNLVRF